MCAGHGDRPAVGMYRDTPHCQECLDNIEASFSKPMMTGKDFVEWYETKGRFLAAQNNPGHHLSNGRQ